jgi:hypothetical protein
VRQCIDEPIEDNLACDALCSQRPRRRCRLVDPVRRWYTFHLAGAHFTPGILALAGMLIVDDLAFFLLSGKSK